MKFEKRIEKEHKNLLKNVLIKEEGEDFLQNLTRSILQYGVPFGKTEGATYNWQEPKFDAGVNDYVLLDPKKNIFILEDQFYNPTIRANIEKLANNLTLVINQYLVTQKFSINVKTVYLNNKNTPQPVTILALPNQVPTKSKTGNKLGINQIQLKDIKTNNVFVGTIIKNNIYTVGTEIGRISKAVELTPFDDDGKLIQGRKIILQSLIYQSFSGSFSRGADSVKIYEIDSGKIFLGKNRQRNIDYRTVETASNYKNMHEAIMGVIKENKFVKKIVFYMTPEQHEQAKKGGGMKQLGKKVLQTASQTISQIPSVLSGKDMGNVIQ